MAICKNCGAAIGDKEVKCPYCMSLQYDAAEEHYMDNLYKVNDSMSKLDDDANDRIKREIVLKGFIALAAIAFAIFVGFVLGYNESKNNYYITDDEFDGFSQWYDNNIDELETCMKNKDFEKMDDIMSDNEYRDFLSESWDGYYVWQTYSFFMSGVVREKNNFDTENGIDIKYTYIELYREALDYIHRYDERRNDVFITKACEKYPEILEEWYTMCKDIMTNDLKISETEYNKDMQEIYSSSYTEYENVKAAAERYYSRYIENR